MTIFCHFISDFSLKVSDSRNVIFRKIFMSALILMQNQVPDIFVFMAQDPQTPLNG